MDKLGPRTNAFILSILPNKQHKDARKKLAKFLRYCSTRIDIDHLCGDYLQSDPDTLLDVREKRHIYTTNEDKAEQKQLIKKAETVIKLGNQLGLGRDADGILRKPTKTEKIITVFETGFVAPSQKPDGIHVLIPSKKTLRFDPQREKITFVEPDEAEKEDENQSEIIFVDSPDVKREYKLLYTNRKSGALYTFLTHREDASDSARKSEPTVPAKPAESKPPVGADPDKILNPRTGRYVMRTGKIGKAIIAAQ